MTNTLSIIVFGLVLTGSIYAQKSNFISTDDGIMHYKTYGKGKPVVIINGGPGMNSEGFAGLAEQLSSSGFLCVIYDQRGTGKSELIKVDSKTITMKNMVEDIEVLRKHLKITKWTVFGQSFGGLLAVQYAHAYPRSVEKLVFSNSGGLNLDFINYVGQRIDNNLNSSERDSLRYYNQLLISEPANKHYQKRRATQLASAYVFQKNYIPQIAERLLQVSFQINQLVFADLQKQKYNFVGKFAHFNKPVLIFQGMDDIISIETAQVVKDNFSRSKLVKLDRCGHYPWLDRPEIFWKTILPFLSNQHG